MNGEAKTGIKDKVKTVLFCLWVIAAMLIVQTVGMVITAIPKAAELVSKYGADVERIRKGIGESINISYALFVGDLLCILVALIWYYRGYVKKDKEKGVYRPLKEKTDGIKTGGFILCGCIACWGLAVVLQRIGAMLLPQTAADVNQFLNMTIDGSIVFGILAVVIMAPIFEELTVRGIIVQRAKRSFGVIGCMVISAIFFGIFHMNLIQGIYVLPMGLFFGFVAYRFNSVIPCFFCHIINNVLGMFVPAFVNPVLLFIVFGAITALIGVKLGYFNFEKEGQGAVPENVDGTDRISGTEGSLEENGSDKEGPQDV